MFLEITDITSIRSRWIMAYSKGLKGDADFFIQIFFGLLNSPSRLLIRNKKLMNELSAFEHN